MVGEWLQHWKSTAKSQQLHWRRLKEIYTHILNIYVRVTWNEPEPSNNGRKLFWIYIQTLKIDSNEMAIIVRSADCIIYRQCCFCRLKWIFHFFTLVSSSFFFFRWMHWRPRLPKMNKVHEKWMYVCTVRWIYRWLSRLQKAFIREKAPLRHRYTKTSNYLWIKVTRCGWRKKINNNSKPKNKEKRSSTSLHFILFINEENIILNYHKT